MQGRAYLIERCQSKVGGDGRSGGAGAEKDAGEVGTMAVAASARPAPVLGTRAAHTGGQHRHACGDRRVERQRAHLVRRVNELEEEGDERKTAAGLATRHGALTGGCWRA